MWGWDCSPWGPAWGPVVWGIANVDSFSHGLYVDTFLRWPLIPGHTPVTQEAQPPARSKAGQAVTATALTFNF